MVHGNYRCDPRTNTLAGKGTHGREKDSRRERRTAGCPVPRWWRDDQFLFGCECARTGGDALAWMKVLGVRGDGFFFFLYDNSGNGPKCREGWTFRFSRVDFRRERELTSCPIRNAPQLCPGKVPVLRRYEKQRWNREYALLYYIDNIYYFTC